MANLYPQNQGWESGTFWLLRSFILDLGGMGFAVPVILSKFVGTSETKSLNNVAETFSMLFSFVCFLVIN